MKPKNKYFVLIFVLGLLLICTSVSALAVWDGNGESGGGNGTAVVGSYALTNANKLFVR